MPSLIDVEKKFMELFWDLQQKLWENYAEDKKHDLNIIDNKMHNLLTKNQQILKQPGNREEIFNKININNLVEKSTEVSLLRNKLDDWDNYPAQNNLERACMMEQDVLSLIRLRNQLSKDHNFNNYFELVMFCERLDYQLVVETLRQHLSQHLSKAQALIKRFGMNQDNWFKVLDNLDKSKMDLDSSKRAQQLFQSLGFEEKLNSIEIKVKQRPISGVVIPVTVPNNVKVLIKPNNSLHGVQVYYHELGHALYHVNNISDGIYQTWDSVTDEVMAVIIEKVACKLFLSKNQQKIYQDLALLESVRLTISFLFEMELINNPSNAQNLFATYYKDLFPVVESKLWALDSFRSIDPVYVHNYVLGEIIGNKTLEYLEMKFEDDYLQWGYWLNENCYVKGRQQSLWEKLPFSI